MHMTETILNLFNLHTLFSVMIKLLCLSEKNLFTTENTSDWLILNYKYNHTDTTCVLFDAVVL